MESKTERKQKPQVNRNSGWQTGVILVMVFFGGFANLATEIIGPRMFASMYGTATSIWAIIISVTLVGLSVGYALGGRIHADNAPDVLPVVLFINALYLLVVSWIVWMIPAGGGTSAISTTAMLAFFPPSVLFGMMTPLSITILSRDRSAVEVSPIVGNLYALSTIGSVLGALSAAYFWIPWVGLSLSLRLFALGLIGFAIYFVRERRLVLSVSVLLVVFVPQPSWEWVDTDGMTLVEQREGYYQTIRVYTDGEEMQMNLGPTFHSKINIETGEPVYSYANNLLSLADTYADDMTGMDIAIIGGAGHALAHAFERRGAAVTVVEIDPIVIELSDTHFGAIAGETIIEDGRVFVENAPSDTYDVVVLDAFDGGAGVPPQLSTREFYESTLRILKPEGIFLYNFIGSPEGRLDHSYVATATTIQAVFPASGALFTRDDLTDRQNIIFAASPTDTRIPQINPLTDTGRVLTDDHNPIEILNERSREGIYFSR